MFKGIIAACVFVAALSVFPAAAAHNETEFCATLKHYAEKSRADIGTMLDGVTRFDGMAVLCGLRRVVYYHFLTIAPIALRDGWKERKQKQWNEIYCQTPVFLEAIEAGWVIMDTITLVDGTRIYLETKC
jgi:hypothetical protein